MAGDSQDHLLLMMKSVMDQLEKIRDRLDELSGHKNEIDSLVKRVDIIESEVKILSEEMRMLAMESRRRQEIKQNYFTPIIQDILKILVLPGVVFFIAISAHDNNIFSSNNASNSADHTIVESPYSG